MSNLVLEDATTSVGTPASTQVAESAAQSELVGHIVTTSGGSYEYAPHEVVAVVGIPAGLITPGWEAAQFLPLDLERDEDGTYIISDAMLLIYGSGESWREALEDYIVALTEYYELVEEGAERGSENDRRELRRAQSYLRRVAR